MPIQNKRGVKSSGAKSLKERILSLPELKDAFAEAVEELHSNIKQGDTEATIAGHFERILYAALRDVGFKFTPTKEEKIETYRHIGYGRTDSRLGSVIIEYKRPAKFKTDKHVDEAVNQLENYLQSITKDKLTPVYGFLTDGIRFIEIQAQQGSIISRLKPSALNAEALLRLTKYIYSLDLTALTSTNLIRDFCGSNKDGALLQTARAFHEALTKNISVKTTMLWQEWEELFRLGHNDKSQQRRIAERRLALRALFDVEMKSSEDEYKALFAVHTAYALVVKLMAYRVVSEIRLKVQLQSWNDLTNSPCEPMRVFCAQLEDGEIFRDLGILNLLEGDFFSWYSAHGQWNDKICEAVRSILQVLGRYEQTVNIFTSNVAIDLFRDLYEATMPQPVRSSFGEFYTPHWLAQHVLQSTNPSPGWRALDPCSGSGTFLIVAIDQVRRELPYLSPKEILEQILDRVVGLDLNPLTVLTSRVNYFIHIANFLPEELESLVIPVYLGDASNVPMRILIEGIECLSYSLKTLKDPIHITLPISIVKHTAQFVRVMLEFEHAIQSRNTVKATNLLLNQIPEGDRKPILVGSIHSLAEKLVDLEMRGWNGIWARIITNFLTIAAFDKFDVIIGNPPWVDWKNLPEGYREKIKALCIDKGLFSGDGRTGGINLNVCALIAYVCMTNWLKETGRLAFLMPRALAVQQSYQGWRRLQSNPQRSFELFVDWTDSGDPFEPVKEDFMTFVIGPQTETKTIPVIRYHKERTIRTKSRDWKDLEEATKYLRRDDWIAGQIIPDSTAFSFATNEQELSGFSSISGECAYVGREGIEFYPQELLLFRFERPGPSAGKIFVRNIQVTKSKYRIPSRTFLVESKYLYPLVKGVNISLFKHNYDGLLVPLPYEKEDPYRPISMDRLSEESPLLLKYYKDFEHVIRSQTEFSDTIRGVNAGEFYGLARTGPYSFAENCVCFRDNTNWCATVVSSTNTPWNEQKRFVFQNHAVSMCERNTGEFISAQEAHYICAILNIPIVKRFIHLSSDERSFKIRPPVYIPFFNSDDFQHRTLADLSRQAHTQPAHVEELQEKMQSIYIEMCKNKVDIPKYKPKGKRRSPQKE